MLKGRLFYSMENLAHSMGPWFRNIGQNMFRQGMANQGVAAHADTIQPSLRCVPTAAGVYPKLLDVSLVPFLTRLG